MDYQKILLKDVEKIELGPENISNQQIFFKSAQPRFHVIRLYYRITEESNNQNTNSEQHGSGYFHSFRSCNLRFFNNLVITTKSNEELTEALRGICHTIQSTAIYYGHNIPFEELNKLSKYAHLQI